MRFNILVIVILTACMAYLINFATKEPVELTSTMVDPAQNYDFFMTDVDTTHFNTMGVSEYRLQALRTTHYPNPDYTLLEAPSFIIYQDGEPPWFVSATSGRIEKGVALNQDKVELIDNVVIHHINSAGQSTNIYTEFLTIYPDSKNLNTDREVLLESTGSKISGMGMTANLELNQIKLLGDLKGRYL
jgi:LPS export ABC transporter protein LptC